MKNNDFGLLGGLFTNPQTNAKAPSMPCIEDNTKEKETKRTWKIRDDLWGDFVALVATSGLTQAEYVNKLFADAIGNNREKIDKYKELTAK